MKQRQRLVPARQAIAGGAKRPDDSSKTAASISRITIFASFAGLRVRVIIEQLSKAFFHNQMNFDNIEHGSGRVLLATADPMLRKTRTMLLNEFGFSTTASISAEHALELIQTTDFDLLVLGNTLAADDCSEIAEAFRQYRPKGRVVEILPASGVDCNDSPDATVVGLDGPAALRKVLVEQLSIARNN